MSKALFETLGTGARVMKLLQSEEEYGGPQSVEDVCKNLGMTNRNARSILSRMCIKGKIDRVEKSVYRAKGDDRNYNPKKPHYIE
ncbi:hypothetical protein [Nitrosopumilus sp.]|uniref:hypothetical protein n=1 Tax=Nitrosopumilus sp. TaxID=2024843 RepID=UPI0034A019E8